MVDNATKSRMEAAVKTLAQAYCFTGHPPYAERAALVPALRIAAQQYGHPPYEDLAQSLAGQDFAQDRIQLLYPSLED